MADDTTGTPPAQGADGAQAQGADDAAAAQAQGAATGTPGADAGQAVADLARKNAELEKDNRKYRLAAQAREEADKAKATEGLSELERLKAENATLLERSAAAERKAQEQSLRSGVTAEATRLGFKNPAVALAAITPSVEFDDEGEPTNVTRLLEALAKSDPYLLTQTDFGGGSRGTSAASGGQTMNDIIRGAASGSR